MFKLFSEFQCKFGGHIIGSFIVRGRVPEPPTHPCPFSSRDSKTQLKRKVGVQLISDLLFLIRKQYSNEINIPGQGLGLQDWLSVAEPSQSLPPLAGSGLLHSRFLVLDPPLHGLLQFGHEDQLLQLPWTITIVRTLQECFIPGGE